MTDARLDRGYERQAGLLASRIAAGERLRGWKAGFGSAASFDALGIDAPLVSFLLASAELPDGAAVDLGGWSKPLCEPEIAVEMGADVAPGADPLPCVGRTLAAFELADLDAAPQDPEAILAGGVYQRHFVLAPGGRRGFDLDGLAAMVAVDGTAGDPVTDLGAAAGDQATVLRHIASVTRERHGRGLRAGDIVLLGSIVPPIAVTRGSSVEFEADGLGRLALAFR